MQKYTGVVIDAKGAPMSGVTIQVNVAGGSAATIYSDNGVTVKANPFVNDANGSLEFYAANGRYDIVLSKTGATFVASDTSDIALFDSGVNPPSPLNPIILLTEGGDDGTPAATTETTLKSVTIPGGTLASDGDLIRFRALLRTAANANTKRIRVKFGATTLIDSTALALNNNAMVVEGVILRTGAATQRSAVVAGTAANNAAWAATPLQGYSTQTPAETLSGDVVLEVTGQNGTATANDLICHGLIVEYLRTP